MRPTSARQMRACNGAPARSTPQRHDRKLEAGTHLMHLETGRRVLYEAVGRALKGDLP